jgi:hypothetical protein
MGAGDVEKVDKVDKIGEVEAVDTVDKIGEVNGVDRVAKVVEKPDVIVEQHDVIQRIGFVWHFVDLVQQKKKFVHFSRNAFFFAELVKIFLFLFSLLDSGMMSDVAIGGIFGIFIACTSCVGLALGIAAVTIANDYGADACIGVFNGISFAYGTWLFIYGWVQIATFIEMFLIGVAFGLAAAMSQEACAAASGCLLLVSYAVLGLFQVAWYVVGAILFFTEVFQTCVHSSQLYVFGLTLFILQSISIACAICAKKAQKKSEE